ncbi:MAG: hypothetical protein DRG09_04455 [Epsilonproteobacteria bacterium]|nr:MAG: hypothetical protein DRG09_04455 [Campylobacterota bacterium]
MKISLSILLACMLASSFISADSTTEKLLKAKILKESGNPNDSVVKKAVKLDAAKKYQIQMIQA